MQRAADFQTPVVASNVAQEAEYLDEMSNRFGILVGGMSELQWNLTGEDSIGHSVISRRVWLPFVKLKVGRRNEFDGALDMAEHTLQREWSKSEERTRWKSPRACAGDVLNAFKSQGFCVPKILIGHPDPQSLTDRVWPREVRDTYRLFQHIEYFESFQTGDKDEASLASELLDACYICRDHTSEYVRLLKNEIESEKGLKNLNDAVKELFYELGEPLPEQKTALVAQAMGKEIVKATQPDGRKDDLIVGALTKLNDRLDRMEERFTQEPLVRNESSTGSGASAEVENVASEQTPNTSTRRRADGEADRRYKEGAK